LRDFARMKIRVKQCQVQAKLFHIRTGCNRYQGNEKEGKLRLKIWDKAGLSKGAALFILSPLWYN
jgi:hypothetical protein